MDVQSEVPDWREYYEEMKEKCPLTVYYPICGGGEECITACPWGDSIWEVKPMKTPMFGRGYRVRLRPVMVRPELCRKCNICVEACPTGALRPVDNPVRHPYLTLLYNSIKLFFKKRYGFRFVFRDEHKEKFRKNNALDVGKGAD